VRIPRKFRFRTQQVEITKRGHEIVLRERQPNLAVAYELLTGFSSDFFKGGRRQPKLDKSHSSGLSRAAGLGLRARANTTRRITAQNPANTKT
jgi:virulence-associated protein VagC